MARDYCNTKKLDGLDWLKTFIKKNEATLNKNYDFIEGFFFVIRGARPRMLQVKIGIWSWALGIFVRMYPIDDRWHLEKQSPYPEFNFNLRLSFYMT